MWPFVILAGAGTVLLLNGGRQGPVTGPLTMVWTVTPTMGPGFAVFLEVVARRGTPANVSRRASAGR